MNNLHDPNLKVGGGGNDVQLRHPLPLRLPPRCPKGFGPGESGGGQGPRRSQGMIDNDME